MLELEAILFLYLFSVLHSVKSSIIMEKDFIEKWILLVLEWGTRLNLENFFGIQTWFFNQ